MKPVKDGRAAEFLFLSECLRRHLDCFVPVTEDGRIDVIVGPFFYRCQVKLLSASLRGSVTRHLPMVKRRGPKGSNSFYRYTKESVDFMIGVCPEKGDVYVVPISSTELWRHSISQTALDDIGTKNAFDLLKTAPGEIRLPAKPSRVVGQRAHARKRASRAWIDRNSLSLGLSFDDGDQGGDEGEGTRQLRTG